MEKIKPIEEVFKREKVVRTDDLNLFSKRVWKMFDANATTIIEKIVDELIFELAIDYEVIYKKKKIQKIYIFVIINFKIFGL